MKSLLYLTLLALAACGAKHSSVKYGQTTKADLIAEQGEPLEKEFIPVKQGEIYQYADNVKYQLKGEIVTAGFRDPKGDERTLLFWKHKFKDCKTETRKLSQNSGHEMPEFELKCAEFGTTVIYTEGSEFVSRIVEHE
jgi:hypothetical protein